MKKYLIIIFCVCSIFSASGANDIDNIITEVISNNLDLKSTEMSLKGEEYSIKSTNNLNDPEVDFEYLFGEKALGDKWGIGVSQSFDWPGLYVARGKSNKIRIDALSYLKIMKSLEIKLQVKLLCIDIININKQIAVQRLIQKNIIELKEKYNLGFNNGEISILDINKLNVEALNILRKLDDLTTQKRVVTESLKAVNGNIDLSASLLDALNDYSGTKLENMNFYAEKINAFDPQNQYLNKMNEASIQDIKVNKMSYFPTLSVGYKHSNELGEKFNGITAGISIPIFSNKNKVNTAKANQIAQQYSQQNIVVSKQSELVSKYAQLEYFNQQISSYKAALKQNDNLAILNKALNGGQINLLNYLMEVKYFLDAEAVLLEMEYSYQQQLANIDKYSLL